MILSAPPNHNSKSNTAETTLIKLKHGNLRTIEAEYDKHGEIIFHNGGRLNIKTIISKYPKHTYFMYVYSILDVPWEAINKFIIIYGNKEEYIKDVLEFEAEGRSAKLYFRILIYKNRLIGYPMTLHLVKKVKSFKVLDYDYYNSRLTKLSEEFSTSINFD